MIESGVTTRTARFANNAESTEALEAITHLANTTTEDRQSIAKLMELNATLVQENKTYRTN